MPTTPEQITAMRALAEMIQADPSIEEAIVDDWGRHGNFQLAITPVQKDRYATRRLRGLINRHLKGSGAHLRDIFGPDPIRERVFVDHSLRFEPRVVGYSRDFWMVDIDFEVYDPEANLFDSQTTYD